MSFVVKPGTLLSLDAHFHELVRSFLNALAALRGHHAPEGIRHAAVQAIAFWLLSVCFRQQRSQFCLRLSW
jgi:hypothetical protein